MARLFRLDTGAGRAIVSTGATRNSRVVLPLALALPGGRAVAAVVVVTQTLVEVLGMLAYVRLVPDLVPADAPAQITAARWHRAGPGSRSPELLRGLLRAPRHCEPRPHVTGAGDCGPIVKCPSRKRSEPPRTARASISRQ